MSARAAARPPIWSGPHRRPSTGWRVALGVVTVGVLMLSGLLLISDRAPDFLRDTFGDRARDLWDRIAASGRAGFLTDGGRPEADLAVHVVMWFVLTVLIALTIWTWWGLIATGVGMMALGLIVEVAQGMFSSSRSVERSDLEADMVGTAMGLAAALATMLPWSAIDRLVDRRAGAAGDIADVDEVSD